MGEKILVFDVGKTNKKLLMFDENLRMVDLREAQFGEYERGGTHFESIEETVRWFKSTLRELAEKHTIDVISVTTHGSTVACIDADGKLVVPIIAYTTEPGEEFQNSFYQKMGDPVSLQKQTATPKLGSLLSTAKTIFYIKEKYSREFDNVKYILNFPQYFSFLLTGNVCTEPTYTGCHSYLWDFHNQRWSIVAAKLKILDKLPPMIPHPWHILGKVNRDMIEATGLDNQPLVTAGIHDSNASLLPYLIKVPIDFALNSTGTWCVAMRPAEEVRFSDEELGKSVFYNLSPFRKPVKTAIFMGGLEFETYTKILKNIHGDNPFPPFDPELVEQIIKNKELFILPSVVQGTGQFPSSKPRVLEKGKEYPLQDIQSGAQVPDFFRDFKKALIILNLSLAIQTKVALERIGAYNCKQIFTEGGFRQNNSYNILLNQLFSDSHIFLTDMKEATAFGAALAGKAALEQKSPLDLSKYFELNLNKVQRVKLDGLTEYMQVFLSKL